MVRAALKNHFAQARELNDLLHDVHPLLYCEGNPVGIKAAMNILGLCGNHFRLPLVPIGQGNYDKLALEIQKAVVLEAK
jgi:4-hydroxy-tetrahydrodipicolinate synthase